MISKTQPARGMRDFLPADVRRREYVIGVIKRVYERYGFEPLETPAVENIETLMGKYGEEGNQLIFKILKRGEHEKTGEADLALRYDLTVPLARVVAEYGDKLPKFFKRYQIQPVWRADRPARGRFREFYQCDVDAIGSRSMIVEAELCAAVSDVLLELGFSEFTIRLNHREILNGIMENAMIDKNIRANVLTSLDKLDKIGIDGVKQELEKIGIPVNSIETIDYLLINRTFITPKFEAHTFSKDSSQNNFEENNKLLGFYYGYIKDSSSEGKKYFEKGLGDLRKIIEFTNNNRHRNHIRFDPALVRGLSYYTGAIMEINVPDLAGSLGGGGRYDNLVGMFSGKDVPACGFSLGLERIIVVMTERGMFPKELMTSAADLMVTISSPALAVESLKLASELRSTGLRVDLYPVRNVKLGVQFKYASKRGFPFVAIIGDIEKAQGLVALKDMRTGEQQSVKREQIASKIKEQMN